MIENHGKEPIELEVKLEVGADFADLFEVKDKLAKIGELYSNVDGRRADARLQARHASCARRSSRPTRRARSARTGSLFQVKIPAQSSLVGRASTCAARGRRADIEDARARRGRRDCSDGGAGPRTSRSGSPARRAWSRPGSRCSASTGAAWSISRRCASRPASRPGALPAAGLPWFMAVFGRDSLITSFQALPFVPELAATTLRALALLQARDATTRSATRSRARSCTSCASAR